MLVQGLGKGVGAVTGTVFERVDVLPPLHQGAFRDAITYLDLLNSLREIHYLEAEEDRLSLMDVDADDAWSTEPASN